MLRQHIVAYWSLILVVCIIMRLWANYVEDILSTWEHPGVSTASFCGTCAAWVGLVTLISRILAAL